MGDLGFLSRSEDVTLQRSWFAYANVIADIKKPLERSFLYPISFGLGWRGAGGGRRGVSDMIIGEGY